MKPPAMVGAYAASHATVRLTEATTNRDWTSEADGGWLAGVVTADGILRRIACGRSLNLPGLANVSVNMRKLLLLVLLLSVGFSVSACDIEAQNGKFDIDFAGGKATDTWSRTYTV